MFVWDGIVHWGAEHTVSFVEQLAKCVELFFLHCITRSWLDDMLPNKFWYLLHNYRMDRIVNVSIYGVIDLRC
jgi:hypothetical protein